MLTELHIRDFGIADQLRLDFAGGLTAVTGETGAGKSLIVNALAFVLGERGQSEFVRTGADACEVSAVFTHPRHAAFLEEARDLGLEPGEDVVIRRELSRAGRGRIWLNDRPGTAGALKRIAHYLCDLHGQHQHQWLLNPESHGDFLDAFVPPTLRIAYREAFGDWQRCRAVLDTFDAELAADSKQRDFWVFQLQELQRIDPRRGEYADLKARRERARNLHHSSELYRLAEAELHGSDDSIVPRLHDLERRFAQAERLDPLFATWVARLAEARSIVESVSSEVVRHAVDGEETPEALEAIERRLHVLYGLQKKFGGDLERAMDERRELERRLSRLEDADHTRRELALAAESAWREVEKQAERLHTSRSDARRALLEGLRRPLDELGLGRDPVTIRHVQLSQQQWTAAGPDRVEFLLAANPREEPKPLARIASGGELSRVMLALKSVLPGSDRVETLVFDEIDAGIGGETAARVADRLAQLALGRQLIVITHLHPIAAQADHHWEVTKRTVRGRHVPQVLILDDKSRIESLGRLIAGGRITPEAREAARALVKPRRDL